MPPFMTIHKVFEVFLPPFFKFNLLIIFHHFSTGSIAECDGINAPSTYGSFSGKPASNTGNNISWVQIFYLSRSKCRHVSEISQLWLVVV